MAYESPERVMVNSTSLAYSLPFNQVPASKSRFGFCFGLRVVFTSDVRKRLTFISPVEPPGYWPSWAKPYFIAPFCSRIIQVFPAIFHESPLRSGVSAERRHLSFHRRECGALPRRRDGARGVAGRGDQRSLLPGRMLPSDYLGQQAWRRRVEVLRAASRQLRTVKPE